MSFTENELRNYLTKFMGPQSIVHKGMPEPPPPPELTNDTDVPISPPSAFGEIPENDITDNEYAPEQYQYLDDTPLSNEFGLQRNYTKLYNISLGLYKINDYLNVPFVEYLFTKKDGNYILPKTELNMEPFKTINESGQHIIITPYLENESAENNNDEDEIETEFLNQCSHFFANIMNKSIKDATTLMQKYYRGFIEMENDNSTTICAVIDCTHIEIGHGTQIEHPIWGTIDEITVKHRIADTPIEESIRHLFLANPILSRIKDDNNSNVPLPIAVYLCTHVNGIYKNVHYDNDDDPLMIKSILNPVVTNEYFDNVYMFSSEPFDYDNLSKIKRYALFIDGAYNFENKDIPFNEALTKLNISTTFTLSKLYNDYTCFSFYEGDHLMWAVKDFNKFTEI